MSTNEAELPSVTFSQDWSEADRCWVGTCNAFPGLSWSDESPGSALAGLLGAIDQLETSDMLRERLASDNGTRHSLDEIFALLGFSREEVEAELALDEAAEERSALTP